MDRPMGGTPPDNNLVPAIISLFCCLPLGIVAIINSTQVATKWAAGDQAGAMASADNAKKFAMIAIGIGIALIVLQVLLTILGIGLGAATGTR